MAQTKIYVNPLNLPAGYSKQIGNTVIYADALNLPAAYEQKVGSTSIWSDGLNLPLGAVTTYDTAPFQIPSKFETIYDQRWVHDVYSVGNLWDDSGGLAILGLSLI